MLNIEKGVQPKELIAFKMTPGASYAGLGGEAAQALKKSLLAEQGNLCCYCMRRIRLDSMKVEHWRPRSRYPAEELRYENLLAACEDSKPAHGAPSEQCCDTHKADRGLTYNPADRNHDVETRLEYKGDGRIHAPNDRVFNGELDDILNLNLPFHKMNRSNVVDGLMEALDARPGTRTSGQLKAELKRWRSRDKNGAFQPYAGVVIYYLKKKLAAPR